MRELKYGGTIVPGDFIAISNGNYLDFGWYAGNGRGTLQYYPLMGVRRTNVQYEQYLADVRDGKEISKWWQKQYEKGLTLKCFWKAYINSVHSGRIMKLPNPEEIFTEKDDYENYVQGREILIKLNLIKQ